MLAIVPRVKRTKLNTTNTSETPIPDVKIVFALSLDGSVVTAASQRERDTPIPARCIDCDQILCFRKGHYRDSGNIWVNGHFAHIRTSNHGESFIHKTAKRILATTPFTFYQDCIYHYSNFCENKLCQTFRPTHAKEEYSFREFFIDVALLRNDVVMAYVEVKHTHPIPDDKMIAFDTSGVPWFEVSAQDVCDQFEKGVFEIKVLRSSLPQQCAKCVQYESWVDKKEERNMRARLEAESNAQIKAEAVRLQTLSEAEKARLKAEHEAVKYRYKAELEAEKTRLQAEHEVAKSRYKTESEAEKARLQADAQAQIKTTETRIKIEVQAIEEAQFEAAFEARVKATEIRLNAELEARVKATEICLNAEFEARVKATEICLNAEFEARVKATEIRLNAELEARVKATAICLNAEFEARVKATEICLNAEFNDWVKATEAKAKSARSNQEARINENAERIARQNANAERVARQNANAPHKKAERDLLAQIFPML